jgi:serine/threonine protein kinase
VEHRPDPGIRSWHRPKAYHCILAILVTNDARLGLVLDGRYRVVERIAAGGMGVVYRGERVGLAKPVAIKFLHRSAAFDADRRQRFEREASAMSRLSHPNLASIIDYGSTDDVPYLVMEYHPGATLKKLISGGALAGGRAVHIARQILAGLGSAHASGVVHRDLKPANVLIVGQPGEDLVKILDFGMAKLLEGDGRPSELSVMAGTILGTAEYMSPEQVRCELIDARADLYAVGILLYEMVTGLPPFQAERDLAVLRAQCEDTPVSPRTRVASLSEPLSQAILRALAKKREDRWQSAEEFQAALLRTPEGRAPSPYAGSEPVRAPTVARSPEPTDERVPRAWLQSAPPLTDAPEGTSALGWFVAVTILVASLGIAAWILQTRGVIHLEWPSWLRF